MSHFIATENIFETIGNYPVVDQFDVNYTNLLSGSTTDHYITGTLFYRTLDEEGGNVFDFSFGERGRIFSKLGGLSSNLPAQLKYGGQRSSYEYQPLRRFAGTVRHVKLSSNNERYFDSMPPDISAIAAKYNNSNGIQVNLDGGVYVARIYIGRGVSDSAIDLWINAYPFEARYANIQRVEKNIFTGLDSSNISRTTSRASITYTSAASVTPGSLTWTDSPPDLLPMTKDDISKLLFGFGDWALMSKAISSLVGDDEATSYGKYAIWYAINSSNLLAAPQIRGWKYGLLDANPHYTSCVFRRDKFGQLRDMLEQRPVSKFQIDSKNSQFLYFGSDETPALPPEAQNTFAVEEATEAVVTVIHKQKNFQNNKLTYVFLDPTGSNSSNISQFCTSSLPYFDGISRNR